MGKVETLEYGSMQPGEDGLYKVTRKLIAFLGQSSSDILSTIQNHYSPMFDYPRGSEDGSKQWAWGYFRMTNGIRSLKGAMQNPEQTLLFHFQEMGGPHNLHHEGSLIQAKQVFKLLENNPDIFLFVQFNEFTKEKL